MARNNGIIIFAIIVVMAFMIGSYILVATFFGVITLIGLVALIESIPPLKWIVRKTSWLVDIALFVFTIIATAKFGLNITAALTIAGLGFTLVYAPHIREQAYLKKYGKPRAIVPRDNCNRK